MTARLSTPPLSRSIEGPDERRRTSSTLSRTFYICIIATAFLLAYLNVLALGRHTRFFSDRHPGLGPGWKSRLFFRRRGASTSKSARGGGERLNGSTVRRLGTYGLHRVAQQVLGRNARAPLIPFVGSFVPDEFYPRASIDMFGAVGDSFTDNTYIFHMVIEVFRIYGKGELIIPANGTYVTGPFNLTSNMVLTILGTIQSTSDQEAFPLIPDLSSDGRNLDFETKFRTHPFINAEGQNNITIRGNGTIDGSGWIWDGKDQSEISRNAVPPVLMEFRSCTDVYVTQVMLKDFPHMGIHPVYCKNVHLHNIQMSDPHCYQYNCTTNDGIHIDSCENVLVENNNASTKDDQILS